MGYNDFGNPRTTAGPSYTIDDKIGRKDSRDIVQSGVMTVSGTPSLLPPNPLGRRNFIRIRNIGGASVYIMSDSDITTSGCEVPTGEEWEENTDAALYISTAAGTVNVQVYERAARFNYS